MNHPEGKLNQTGRIHVQPSPLLLKQLVVTIQQINQEQKQLNQYHHMDRNNSITVSSRGKQAIQHAHVAARHESSKSYMSNLKLFFHGIFAVTD